MLCEQYIDRLIQDAEPVFMQWNYLSWALKDRYVLG